MDAAILRVGQVLEIVGIRNRTTLWRMCQEGRFPAPVRIGVRAIGWRISDIDAWLGNLSEVVSRP